MVDRTGRLITLLLGWLFSSVHFGRRCVDAIRDADSRGTVVYVMRHRSLLDFLYFNFAYLRDGLPLVRFANGVKTWLIRRPIDLLRHAFRRRNLPDDERCFELLVRGDAPTMLFLSRAKRGESDHLSYSLPYLERLIEAQRASPQDIVLLPQLLVWEKRPERRSAPSIFEEVFGSARSPGAVKKFFSVFLNWGSAFLNLGQPLVQISSEVNVRRFIDEREGLADKAIALELHDQLEDALRREERVIVGPWVKSATQMRDEILADPRTQRALAEVAADSTEERSTLIKRSRKIIEEIAADFSILAIKSLSALLTPIWHQIYEGIDVDDEGLHRVRRIARDKRIVLVPSHKSHADYLLLSYVFFREGLIPPHIAAGDNLSFWPLGPLFRRSGAFFLRRSFSGDELYRRLFNAYLIKLLEEGFAIEFFIEGTRSRTGKLNPPRYGMLNMIVDAFREGDVRQLAFIPVSVGYERIIEGSSYQRELEGGEKKSENIAGLLKSTKILRSKYGRVYLEFGEAVDLGSFLAENRATRDDAVSREELARSVRRLAYRVIHRINEATTVTPSAVAALILLNNPARGMDREKLSREAGFVLTFLTDEKSARLSRTLRDALRAQVSSIHRPTRAQLATETLDEFDQEFVEQDVSLDDPEDSVDGSGPVPTVDDATGRAVVSTLEEALGLLADNKLVEIKTIEGEPVYRAAEERRGELSFYKNNIIHFFVPEAIFATVIFAAPEPMIDLLLVRNRVRFLSRLLKLEFCFEESRRFNAVFDETKAYFVERGWITESPDGESLEVPHPSPAGVEFLRGLLLSNLETYFLAATTIREHASDWADTKTLTKPAVTRGKGLYHTGELLYSESISRPTIENALRVFREWQLLEQREIDRGKRTIREYRRNEECLEELDSVIDDLQLFLAPQERDPQAALRDA